MTEGSFAQFLPKDVLHQVEVREEKFGKPNKTAEEFEVIHGNTVWCLLRSGVDAQELDRNRWIIPATPEKQRELINNSTNKAAKDYVLGGELHPVSDSGAFTSKLAGVQLSDVDSNAMYRTGESGDFKNFRPGPGITGFSVRTKDTWGMILEATINIKVWSRDDLDKMDLVYFKPGFPALFEWGHTLYFDKDGNIQKMPELMVSNEQFFKGGMFEDLDKQVQDARQKNCNREALFGYITNFSWSFQPDGSFDCTLKLLSKGGVLEGLRVSTLNTGDNKSEKQSDNFWWKKSVYHTILQNLYSRWQSGDSLSVTDPTPKIGSKIEELDSTEVSRMPGIKSKTEGPKLISFRKAIVEPVNLSEKVQVPRGFGDIFRDFPTPCLTIKARRDIPFFYVTLRYLLHLLNCMNMQDGGMKWDTTTYNQFGHAKLVAGPVSMPSLNPYVAIKPSQLKDSTFGVVGPKDSGIFDVMEECTEPDDILNIWVSYNFFVDLIERQCDGKPNNYEIEPVIKELLAEIQKAFGNVNNFSLWNSQDTGNTWQIVDLANVSIRDKNPKDIPTLNITGLKNTVIQLDVHSDISNDMVNEMCIAATAPAPHTDESLNEDECLVFWGENCKARWITSLYSKGSPEDKQKHLEEQKDIEEKSRKDWEKSLKKLYELFRKNKGVDVSSKESKKNIQVGSEAVIADVSSKYSDLQLQGERYYNSQVQKDRISKAEFQMGIVPFKATITMLGISRLLIGNTFMVKNGILPKKYDNWGYIITGIEHKVINNQWFTTIKTNYFPVFYDSLLEKSDIEANQRIQRVVPGQNTQLKETREPKLDDSTCGYRVAFLNSGIDYGPRSVYHGLCGRYTVNWARAYAVGSSAIKGAEFNSVKSMWVPKGSAGGDAYDTGYFNSLEMIGYKKGEEVVLQGSQIRLLAGGSYVNGVQIKEGDVLAFTDGSRSHTCFYDGTRWCSDTDQVTANCYSEGGPYRLRLFSSPHKSPDWNCEARA